VAFPDILEHRGSVMATEQRNVKPIERLWLTVADRGDGPEVEGVDFDWEGASGNFRTISEPEGVRIISVDMADVLKLAIDRQLLDSEA
jgi:hypothetical protein